MMLTMVSADCRVGTSCWSFWNLVDDQNQFLVSCSIGGGGGFCVDRTVSVDVVQEVSCSVAMETITL